MVSTTLCHVVRHINLVHVIPLPCGALQYQQDYPWSAMSCLIKPNTASQSQIHRMSNQFLLVEILTQGHDIGRSIDIPVGLIVQGHDIGRLADIWCLLMPRRASKTAFPHHGFEIGEFPPRPIQHRPRDTWRATRLVAVATEFIDSLKLELSKVELALSLIASSFG